MKILDIDHFGIQSNRCKRDCHHLVSRLRSQSVAEKHAVGKTGVSFVQKKSP